MFQLRGGFIGQMGGDGMDDVWGGRGAVRGVGDSEGCDRLNDGCITFCFVFSCV